MTTFHSLDPRPPEAKEDDLINLNIIQDILEEDISAYALQKPENLYDKDNQEILRKLEFSRGLKRHQIVLAPDGFIRWISRQFPSTLLQDIHNALLGIEILNDENPYSPLPDTPYGNPTITDPSESTGSSS